MLLISCQIIYCPKEVQIICLSATVANADELGGWISEVICFVLHLILATWLRYVVLNVICGVFRDVRPFFFSSITFIYLF